MKNVIKTFFAAFFRTIAAALGIILAIIFIIAFAIRPTTPGRTEGFTMVPDHNWEIKEFSKTAPTILKISIHGVIGETITSDDIKNTLLDSLDGRLDQNQIKGVLLSINSGGGLATDSDAIYTLLKDYKKRFKTPIYTYVEGIMASGALMIGCASDKIFASEGSLIGSVGVLVPPAFNFVGLMEKAGVQALTITAGKSKDELNPFRPWKANEGENVQYIADAYYQRFLNIVTEARPDVTKQNLIQDGASVYPTADAIQKKMIDGAATLEGDVILKLAEDLKIQDNYQVIEFETGNWIKSLLQTDNPFKKEIKITVPGMLSEKLQGQYLYLYQPFAKETAYCSQ